MLEEFLSVGSSLLTSLGSDLLFATFLSGDGNFHLQLMQKCKSLLEEPSLFGDLGAWVPYEVYDNYVKAAKNPRATDTVSSPPSTFNQSNVFHFRMQPVAPKLEPPLEIDLLRTSR
jgi:hypothetical protein